MTRELSNLDSESIALLYLSGELSAEQKAEVDAMLQLDLVLRGEVERLRAAKETIDVAFARSDAARPMAISEAAATRKVSRAMSQWRVDWLARPTGRAKREFHWRSLVPAAVAASVVLIIGMSVWWSRVGNGNNLQSLVQNPEIFANDSTENGNGDELGDDSVASLLFVSTGDDDQLASAEQELSALRFLSEVTREDGAAQ